LEDVEKAGQPVSLFLVFKLAVSVNQIAQHAGENVPGRRGREVARLDFIPGVQQKPDAFVAR